MRYILSISLPCPHTTGSTLRAVNAAVRWTLNASTEDIEPLFFILFFLEIYGICGTDKEPDDPRIPSSALARPRRTQTLAPRNAASQCEYRGLRILQKVSCGGNVKPPYSSGKSEHRVEWSGNAVISGKTVEMKKRPRDSVHLSGHTMTTASLLPRSEESVGARQGYFYDGVNVEHPAVLTSRCAPRSGVGGLIVATASPKRK